MDAKDSERKNIENHRKMIFLSVTTIENFTGIDVKLPCPHSAFFPERKHLFSIVAKEERACLLYIYMYI